MTILGRGVCLPFFVGAEDLSAPFLTCRVDTFSFPLRAAVEVEKGKTDKGGREIFHSVDEPPRCLFRSFFVADEEEAHVILDQA